MAPDQLLNDASNKIEFGSCDCPAEPLTGKRPFGYLNGLISQFCE